MVPDLLSWKDGWTLHFLRTKRWKANKTDQNNSKQINTEAIHK